MNHVKNLGMEVLMKNDGSLRIYLAHFIHCVRYRKNRGFSS